MESTTKLFEHITVVGLAEERDQGLAMLYNGDYSMSTAGPFPLGGGKFDSTRFKITGVRAHQEEQS